MVNLATLTKSFTYYLTRDATTLVTYVRPRNLCFMPNNNKLIGNTLIQSVQAGIEQHTQIYSYHWTNSLSDIGELPRYYNEDRKCPYIKGCRVGHRFTNFYLSEKKLGRPYYRSFHASTTTECSQIDPQH